MPVATAGRVLAAALMAALGCDSAAPKAAARSSVTIAVRADVTGFFPNPPILNEGYTMDVNWNLYEGLVRYDNRFRIEPAVAQRWENPDDRTYVFDLRPGLRFADGRAVSAEDVAASLTAPRNRR
jgi:peptide/nickel transport system substrate-binding protein